MGTKKVCELDGAELGPDDIGTRTAPRARRRSSLKRTWWWRGAVGPSVRVWFAHPACLASNVTKGAEEPRTTQDDMRMSTLVPDAGHERAGLGCELVSPQCFADSPQPS
ncbi:hypothetical protein [Streptomyces sp. NPDC051993]|uniref:hypothetical protein n=1 Tax=Streptomyces sp. NPDC051993 TaxID=3155286 RepID=UPI0034497940